ncbi:hypothetical protein BLNAU_2018 [Blattamonas nauphoetae]|uniref:Uncharacterized protein n=1 Tax=Blattamonas nauphoetae TaxID=2049346 RepID=A0ABQ9YGV5_9EUKA|nr:hypothetical protein BLNAU_2018 [Blattamonas nauphoetae]
MDGVTWKHDPIIRERRFNKSDNPISEDKRCVRSQSLQPSQDLVVGCAEQYTLDDLVVPGCGTIRMVGVSALVIRFDNRGMRDHFEHGMLTIPCER